MPDARKHGVVVVHGQVSQATECGQQLALVANGIADTLENAGGTVQRSFLAAGGRATGSLRVTAPGGAATEEFDFVEAYWAQSLPPASADVVARWILRRAPREAMTVVRGFWRNIANDRIEAGPGGRSGYPARAWLRATFTIELAVLTVVIAVLAALSIVLSPLVYALYTLGGGGRSKAGGFLTSIFTALHQLDPFLSGVMGDSWRFVEDGMWSVNVRDVVENAVVGFYDDPDITDITIIAHSAGCGVSYDALALGRTTGDAAARNSPAKRLTLVTAGSAMNRFYALSKASKTSPYTRRLSAEPLDPRITGVSKSGSFPATTADDVALLQSRFYWLDIYARMDLVPGGGASDEVVAMAGIDPCQLKCRPVINEDSLVQDHFGYFSNTDLVVPRLIRAIYGGAYPWSGTGRADTPAITGDRVSHRTRAVATLQAIRMTVAGMVLGYAAFFVASRPFRDWSAKDAGAVINLDLGRFGELITMALVLFGPIVVAFYLYDWIRGWWFDTL